MRILWLKTELLHPVDKGGKIRTYHMLRELRRQHEVIYVALDDGSNGNEALERAREYSDEVITVPHPVAPRHSARFYRELAMNVISPLPYFLQKYRSKAMQEVVRRALKERPFDVLVCDFLMPAVNLPAQLPTPSVLFQHNVEAEIWRRHSEVATNRLKKLYFRGQWRKARRFEAITCRRFDRLVAVSERDRSVIQAEYGLELVDVVQTGVDTEYFHPRRRQPDPNNIVFTGSMDWLPNEDAMVWFVRHVLPLIRTKVPRITLSIVGRRPSPAVLALSNEVGVTVPGGVPDIRPYLEEAAVYVVPLRIGGGTRLKIYEAMAMELPVVSTSVGMEGLPLTPGNELLVADDPGTFADSVVRLIRDPEGTRRMAQRGAERVRRDAGWDRVASSFAAICEGAVRDRVEYPMQANPRADAAVTVGWRSRR